MGARCGCQWRDHFFLIFRVTDVLGSDMEPFSLLFSKQGSFRSLFKERFADDQGDSGQNCDKWTVTPPPSPPSKT